MSKQLLAALTEVVEAGVITPETAEAIKAYYAAKRGQSPNRIVLAFAILGALLVGAGVLLIVASNWDRYSQTVKTLIAFVPLVLAQILTGYSLLRRPGQLVWREASAILLILTLGACMALVSQIYHLMGALSTFLFWWVVLSLPLLYLLGSSTASLLTWVGMTYYGAQAGYFERDQTPNPWYWLMVMAALPYYVYLSRRASASNFANFHHFLVPLSIVIVFGTVAQQHPVLMYPAYMVLLGLLHLIGTWIKQTNEDSNISGYQLSGKLAPLGILLFFSFYDLWKGLRLQQAPEHWTSGQEFYGLIALVVLYLGLAAYLHFYRKIRIHAAFNLLPLAFTVTFFIGLSNPWLSTLLVNLIVFGLGLFTIVEGSRQQSLADLNIGMLTLVILMACRFNDLDLDYITRGILFILVGVGFFFGNYWLIKKKKA